MSGTEAFWYQLAITVASTVYQRYQSRKQKAASDAAADKQKGFQLVTENTAQPIPVCYGRFKVGGTRAYHMISNDYVYAAPPTENSNFFLSTGDLKTENIGPRSGDIVATRVRISYQGSGVDGITQYYDSGPISEAINLFIPSRDITLPTGGWDSSNTELRTSLVGNYATVEYGGDRTVQFSISAVGADAAYITLSTPSYVEDVLSGSLNSNISDTKREFLFIQQTISFGDLHSVVYVDVDDKPFDDKEFNYGQRIHVHYNGSVADPLATANGIPSTNVFTNLAYLTGVFRLNRDDPNYNGIPQVTIYGEGVMVRPITSASTIGSTKIYSNNQAELILDYLTHPIYGRKVPDSKIDIPSFYRAKRIIDKVVQEINTPFDADMEAEDFNVNGKYWREKFRRWKDDHETGDTFTRQIKLYEFNGIIDTGVPLRDNIEIFLQSMGLADLIWSGGKYKLKVTYAVPYVEAASYVEGDIVQYDNPTTGHPELWVANTTTTDIPGSSADWDQEHVAVITDEDIDNDAQVSISWPTLQNKLNRCTVNFINEANDFDEDSVSWPPRNGTVHTAYLAEDNGIVLEKSLFANGCSDIYHAQAIAEQEVRLSRDLVVYNFSLSPRWSGLEPGDVIVLKSSRLGIPGELLKIESVKLKENVFVEVQAIKFDARQLAWNAKDEEIVPPRNLYDYALKQATNLAFVETGATFPTQSGVLTWDAPDDNRIRSYKIMYTEDSIYAVNENSEWKEIGNTTRTRFETPPVPAGNYTLAVVSVGFDGTLSPEMDYLRETRWPTIECVVTIGPVDGDSAQLLVLSADSPGFAFESSLATTASFPSSILFTAKLVNITGTVTFVGTAYNAAGTSLGTVDLTETSATTATMNSAQFTTHADTKYVKVVASLGSITDSTSVLRGNDGDNSVQLYLDNPAAVVPANSDGSGGDYSLAETNVKVYQGITDVTNLWSFAITDLGLDSFINGGAGPVSGTSSVVVSVTGAIADLGSVAIVATRAGYPTLVGYFNITKSRAGFDGSTAQTLVLSASSNAFVYENAEATTSTSPSITFTAQLQNIATAPSFSAVAYDVTHTSLGAVTLTGSGVTRTLTSANFNAIGSGTDVRYVVVTASSEGLSDLVFVYRGDNGSDALTLELTNPAHTIPTNADGTAGDYSNAVTQVKMWRGILDETSLWNFTRTNTNTTSLFQNSSGTIGPSVDPVYLAVTDLSADSGKVTITATRSGYPTMSRDMILAKAKQGIAGQALVLKSNGFAFTFPDSSSTVSSDPPIIFEAVLIGITGTVTFVAEGFTSGGSSLGVRSMTSLSATSASLDYSQFIDNDGTSVRYVKVTASLSGHSDYEYVNRGDANSNLPQIRLTNPSGNINTDVNGDNGVFTNATTLVEVYEGLTLSNTSWTFSKTDSNVTSTINSGAGPISGASTITVAVTAITADTGSVTITATKTGYPSLTIVFSLYRIKGANGYTLSIVPKVIPLITDASGNITSYANAFSDLNVLKDNINDNSNWTFSKTDQGVTSSLVGNKVTITDFGGTTLVTKQDEQSWNIEWASGLGSFARPNDIYDSFFYMAENIYIAYLQAYSQTTTKISRTTDGGQTWSQVTIGRTDRYFNCSRTSNGVYIGCYQGVIRSTDNGATWTYYSVTGAAEYVTHIFETGGYTYAITSNWKLWRSSNGTSGWSDVTTSSLSSNSGSLTIKHVFVLPSGTVIIHGYQVSTFQVKTLWTNNLSVWTGVQVGPNNFSYAQYSGAVMVGNKVYSTYYPISNDRIEFYMTLDGKSWTYVGYGPAGGSNGMNFKYINGYFLMCGGGGDLYGSKDLANWLGPIDINGSTNMYNPTASYYTKIIAGTTAINGTLIPVGGSNESNSGLGIYGRFLNLDISVRDEFADTAKIFVEATNTATSQVLSDTIIVTKKPKTEALIVSSIFPEVVLLPSTSDGVVSSFNDSNIVITITEEGASVVGSYAITYTVSNASITLSNPSAGVYKVTAMSSAVSSGTITFTCKRTGYNTKVLQVTVNKSLGSEPSGTRSGAFSSVNTLGGFVSLKLLTNGDAQLKRTSGGSFEDAGDWYYPNQTGIGSTWYVKTVVESGSWTTDPSAGSWIQLNSDRVWELTRGSTGTSTVVAKVFYNQSASDAGVVQYSRITLETTVL